MNKFRIILSTGLLLSTITTFSQQIEKDLISNAGETFASEDIQLEWSIGEGLTANHESSNMNLSQGFHSTYTYEASILNRSLANPRFKVSPNPTTDFISIKTVESESNISEFSFNLIDLSGKTLDMGFIKTEQILIDMSPYKTGTYILQMLRDYQLVETYKIIKE